ncbi:MAG: hypothetical protein ACTSRX_03470 [Promethearchaeota archaeon]
MKLNKNLKERKLGYICLSIYFVIFLVYLFFDGWSFEWLHYGYDGANQHFDLDIFSDMIWSLNSEGERVITSTNNLHNLVYICYYTGLASVIGLITGNEWFKKGSIATLAFPVISFFSSINPFVATDIFTWDIFRYHFYFLQIFYDLNHICGMIMGVTILYNTAKKGEKVVDFKKMAPIIMFTWLLYYLAKFFLQKNPFSALGSELGVISTNQINNMPFYFYGLEYIIVVVLLYFISFLLNAADKWLKKSDFPERVKISYAKLITFVPFIIFVVLTIIFIAAGLIVLQVIPKEAFIQ